MKLNIEQIAPYIPYGLNGIYNLQDVVSSYKNEHRNKVLTSDSCTFFLLYCKPILRPMSDLKNFKLIPPPEPINSSPSVIFSDNTIEMCYYQQYKFLFKNLFDVFDLIGKGLAIDINTLNNDTHSEIKRN